jgi:hypothetical protein
MHGKNAKESAPQVSWNARITKYVGLISFRISVCKKPGGDPPLNNNGRESENDVARHGEQARPSGLARTPEPA